MQIKTFSLWLILLVSAANCANVSMTSNKDAAFTGKIRHVVVQYNASNQNDSLGFYAGKAMQRLLAKKGVVAVISFRSAVDLESERDWKARTSEETEQFRMEISWSQKPDVVYDSDRPFTSSTSVGAIDIQLFEKNATRPVWRAAVDVNTSTIDGYSEPVAKKLANAVIRHWKSNGLL